MNRSDDLLQRLLKIAARTPGKSPGPPPPGLETRVLAHWRSGAGEDASMILALLFRRAVICAAVITVLSILLANYRGVGSETPGVVALANYEINSHLPP